MTWNSSPRWEMITCGVHMSIIPLTKHRHNWLDISSKPHQPGPFPRVQHDNYMCRIRPRVMKGEIQFIAYWRFHMPIDIVRAFMNWVAFEYMLCIWYAFFLTRAIYRCQILWATTLLFHDDLCLQWIWNISYRTITMYVVLTTDPITW